MRSPLLILITFLFAQSCAAVENKGSYRGYETPNYKIIRKEGTIELREYPEILVAEVEVEGEREEAVRKGFKALAGYIFGKNEMNQKVAMTSPVSQEKTSEKIAMTSPVSQISDADKKWRVQFSMPQKYSLATLPKPKNDQIKFKILKAKKVAAIRFSGKWSDKNFNEKTVELENFIKEQKLKTKGAAVISYYDDPFTFPWNRRNEVIWEVK